MNRDTATEESSDKSQIFNTTDNISSLHAKLDQHFTSQKIADAKNSSTIMQKLNDMSALAILPSKNAKMFNDNRKIIATPTNKNKDPLDWSFSCNQSLITTDNGELFHMLNGFEQNTWASFDYIRHKMNDTMDTVVNIESICKNFNSEKSNQRLESPVTESIKIDILQSIQNKCELIEKAMSVLGNDVRTKIEGDCQCHRVDLSTHQLREHCLKLVSQEESASTKNTQSSQTETDFGPHEQVNSEMYLKDTEVTSVSYDDDIDFGSLTTRLNALLALPDEQVEGNVSQQITTAHSSSSSSIPSLVVGNVNHSNMSYSVTDDASSNLFLNAANLKSLHLLGENVTSNLLDKHFHISPFDVKVTPKSIIDYIADNAKVNRKRIKIKRLTKKGQDLSILRHVNFKIETDVDTAKIIAESKFWPEHIKIKLWTVKKVAKFNEKSFLVNKST